MSVMSGGRGRVRRGVGRLLGVLALTGSAVFAVGVVAAPAAYASEGASNCTSNWNLCTAIQYGKSYQSKPRDPSGPGGGSGSSGYVSPCWLEPNTAWGAPDTDASSPEELAQYMSDMNQYWHHDPDFQSWFAGVENIYFSGHGADPGIGLTTPPYNEGVSGGRWYAIACDADTSTYTAYTDIQEAMGVSAANLDYEGWFWIKDVKQIPANVPTVTPNMLAEYATNHVRINPKFPALSPAIGAMQTVNLPVESVNIKNQNGYHEYTTTATLAGITSTVTSYPVSVTYTANPADLISPESVTCKFNKNGSIKSPCPTFTFTQPVASGSQDSITATSVWHVEWTGSTDFGEPGWDRQLPGINPAFTQTVTVQEIQTIN